MGMVMAVATIAMTAVQMVQSVKAAKVEEDRLRLENEQDHIATIGAEADRKYELNKSIASQIAYSADPGGSTAIISDEERRLERTDTERAEYMYKIRKRGRTKARREVRKASYFGAASQAGSGIMGAAGNMKGGAGKLKTGVGTKIPSTPAKQTDAFKNPYGA
jgi:hypothetical protein